MERLRVGIDGYNLAMRHGTGVASYGHALARTLKDAGHCIEGLFGLDVGKDPAMREVLFFDLLAREPPPPNRRRDRRELRRLRRMALNPFGTRAALDVPLTERVEKGAFAGRFLHFDRLASVPRLFEVAHRHFAIYGRFVRVAMADPPPIMHWTYPVPVELIGARNLYTIHDIVPLRLPYATLDAKAAYRRLLARCIERAAHVCTVSEASRADILAEFDADPAHVTNTYQAAPDAAETLARHPAADAAMVGDLFGLEPQGYFLFFGAIEPKKNVARLLEAYLSLRTATPLVVVGGRSWQADEELRLLDRIKATQSAGGGGPGQVVRLEFLARPMLLRLIRTARAVAFPSLYEGFGLPVLEAMQLGTPVLTSRTSSLPEVAGEAAVLVDPYSVPAIAEGLRALDEDAALRARLAAAGRIQAASFSEERYRAALEAMYGRVLRSPP